MTTIKHRRGTAAAWASVNPVLAAGEKGYEIDTNKFKMGDGLTNYSDLSYFIDEDSVDEKLESFRPNSGPSYNPRWSLTGPAATDNPTLTLGNPLDAAFNEAYQVQGGGVLPDIWPIDAWGKMSIASNIWSAKTSNPTIASVTTYRIMADGPEVLIFTYAAGFWIDLFIDGRPYASNPIKPEATSGYSPFGWQKLVFGSAKPRLLEFRMVGGLIGVYTKKPYRIWKPAPDPNPKVAVVGDSFVAPTIMNDAATGSPTEGLYLRGIYQRMPALLGISNLTTDGLGGTGYLAPGGASAPYSHSVRVNWLQDLDPDVIVMHGGGANDFYNSLGLTPTTNAAIARFRGLRENHPNAKLVFVEGFAPPLFNPAVFNPNYKLLREAVQADLESDNIGVYYLDVASTRPPIQGNGYVTAPTGVGNSDILVGSDSVHLTVKGNEYVRHYLAPKLIQVLSDDGSLAGTLL